jgi:hypothetical protein
MSESSKSNGPLKTIKGDIRDIRNDIERIKSDTHSINRILTLRDVEVIKRDLTNLIGRSTIKAAILHLTKERMNSAALSKALQIEQGNLNKFMNPILEKGYITGIKIGREKYFQRVEILDLIGFDEIPEFSELIKKWEQGLHDS